MRRFCNILFVVLFSGFIFAIIFSCEKLPVSGKKINVHSVKTATAVGPQTLPVNFAEYRTVFYVSSVTGSDAKGDGSKTHPWSTIRKTLSEIKNAGSSKRLAICVGQGDYAESTLQMKSFVDLFGGFESKNWQRDIFKYSTILDGGGTHRVLAGANHCRLDGFIISKGSVRGKGAGIYCDGVSPTITNNIFVNNRTLAPVPWKPIYRHEIANDGGAIYCQNGSEAVIRNNLFVKNETEAGRGAGIAVHRNCKGRIVDNVFMENVVGKADPLRSSDGGAMSVFDWSSPLIENNVFLNNRALAHNDAGGLFVALWSAPIIRENIFVGNYGDDDAGALFVGGQEHRYDRPLDPLPPADSFYVQISKNVFMGNWNRSHNSGVTRVTMESRGRFENNVSAYNSGIYFQRSEVAVVNNTILENFLFVETKAGLKTGEITNNIVWADFDLQTATPVSYCDIKEQVNGTGNLSEDPMFDSDQIKIVADAVSYHPRRYQTDIYLSAANFRTNQFRQRIVKTGKKWGVVVGNTANTISIWGDFWDEIEFVVMPTYHLQADSPCREAGTIANTPSEDFDGDHRPDGSSTDIGADEIVSK